MDLSLRRSKGSIRFPQETPSRNPIDELEKLVFSQMPVYSRY